MRERGARTTTVAATDGSLEAGHRDASATTPVAGYVTDSGKPSLLPVRRDRSGVDALAANQSDPPSTRCARAECAERVVDDDHLARQVQRADRCAQESGVLG